MLDKTFPVVRMHDPALRSATFADLQRYGKTRDPADMPELHEEAADPVVFHCRRLTRSQLFDFVEVAQLENRKFGRSFTTGVVKVTGGAFGPDGWRPADAEAPGYRGMTDAELDGQDFAFADILDVGQVIYLRSIAPKDCCPHFPLLPTSLVVWEGYARQYAEQSRDDADQNSSKPKGG